MGPCVALCGSDELGTLLSQCGAVENYVLAVLGVVVARGAFGCFRFADFVEPESYWSKCMLRERVLATECVRRGRES